MMISIMHNFQTEIHAQNDEMNKNAYFLLTKKFFLDYN